MSTHRPALTLARRSVAAHCASLRVLATSALRAFDGQRPGRECIFTFRTALALRRRGVPCLRTSCARHFSPSGLHLFASICSAKNARNDVHAVISDLSLVLPMLCQCSVAGSKILSLPFYLAIFVFKMRCEAIRMITIDNVTKIYTKGKKHITALKDINLSIPTGSVVGFLGSNGAGKIRRHQAL